MLAISLASRCGPLRTHSNASDSWTIGSSDGNSERKRWHDSLPKYMRSWIHYHAHGGGGGGGVQHIIAIILTADFMLSSKHYVIVTII